MGMGANIERLDTESIQTLATTLTTGVEAMLQEIENMNKAVTGDLASVWQGEAAEKFKADWSIDYAAYKQKHEELLNLINTIKTVATNTDTAEQDISVKMQYHSM